MKQRYSLRHRSASRSRESAMPKKNSHQEHPFFAAPSEQSFFKPNVAIQRKCDHCEAEEKKAQRMTGPSEEEKKVQKMSEKKEEEIHREPEKKEEVIHKIEDKKEDKELHRAMEAKEEDKIQRQEDKKEEDNKIQKKEKEEYQEAYRQPEHKEEEKNIAKKDSTASGNGGIAATSTYIQSLSGKGNTLPKEAQYFFGKRMGYDFSNVKIHTGTEAEQSAKDINAKAYAVDNNIVFNKGQYNPASAEGKKLLAHELTHVMQQNEQGVDLVNRVAENTASSGKATNSHNERAYGCEGVNVQGHTDANYTDTYTAVGTATPSSTCKDGCDDDCVVATGNIFSVFQANPAVTLPLVPDGLSDCENNAVTKFINTTLTTHEQQHVSAFNTYNGTVKTPYKFVGCQSDLDAYQQSMHDAINKKKQDAANAKSSKLDGKNGFNPPIPCDCKNE